MQRRPADGVGVKGCARQKALHSTGILASMRCGDWLRYQPTREGPDSVGSNDAEKKDTNSVWQSLKDEEGMPRRKRGRLACSLPGVPEAARLREEGCAETGRPMPLSGGGGHALCRWRCADLRGAMFIRASSSSEAVPSLLSRDESESSSSLPAAFSPSSARDSKPSVPTPKAQPSHLNWSWSCRLPERKNVDTTTGTVNQC